ncbi:MAG TPA: hypothetical protein VK395_30400 [Gemmataceae bacterium]|nr:hypothetical protein [Gemmataceae bacterium]
MMALAALTKSSGRGSASASEYEVSCVGGGSSNYSEECETDNVTALKFVELSETWKKDTEYLSKLSKKVMHPAYQRIIGMGRDAIPFILNDLKEDPADWFWALTAITGENPVAEASAGKVEEMAKAWLLWGRERGYGV